MARRENSFTRDLTPRTIWPTVKWVPDVIEILSRRTPPKFGWPAGPLTEAASAQWDFEEAHLTFGSRRRFHFIRTDERAGSRASRIARSLIKPMMLILLEDRFEFFADRDPRFLADNPADRRRDPRFVKGHACPILFALLRSTPTVFVGAESFRESRTPLAGTRVIR